MLLPIIRKLSSQSPTLHWKHGGVPFWDTISIMPYRIAKHFTSASKPMENQESVTTKFSLSDRTHATSPYKRWERFKTSFGDVSCFHLHNTLERYNGIRLQQLGACMLSVLGYWVRHHSLYIYTHVVYFKCSSVSKLRIHVEGILFLITSRILFIKLINHSFAA